MSILDFTTDLFRDPINLRSFVDDPDQALHDAGLPDATPEQVHDLLPLVAESMPADHPLQTVVHSADPAAALAELDVDELGVPSTADLHDHHHPTQLVEKALGTAECRPDDHDDDRAAETIHVGHWNLVDEGEKALGDVFAPQIEEGAPTTVDDYPEVHPDDHPDNDHALDDGGVNLDISGVVWGEAVE
jgi:hypothetical protein